MLCMSQLWTWLRDCVCPNLQEWYAPERGLILLCTNYVNKLTLKNVHWVYRLVTQTTISCPHPSGFPMWGINVSEVPASVGQVCPSHHPTIFSNLFTGTWFLKMFYHSNFQIYSKWKGIVPCTIYQTLDFLTVIIKRYFFLKCHVQNVCQHVVI